MEAATLTHAQPSAAIYAHRRALIAAEIAGTPIFDNGVFVIPELPPRYLIVGGRAADRYSAAMADTLAEVAAIISSDTTGDDFFILDLERLGTDADSRAQLTPRMECVALESDRREWERALSPFARREAILREYLEGTEFSADSRQDILDILDDSEIVRPKTPGGSYADLADSLRALIADARQREGYWTEGTDNLIHQAEVLLGDVAADAPHTPAPFAPLGRHLATAPVIVTISGGVADIAANPAGLPVYLLDYDDLKEELGEREVMADAGEIPEPLDLAPECLAFIREHDDAGFVAKVNARVRHPFTTADRLPNAPNKCDSCGQSAAAAVHDWAAAKSTCQHGPTEDCMNCARCGRCREDLDDNDLCPDCLAKQPHTAYLDADAVCPSCGNLTGTVPCSHCQTTLRGFIVQAIAGCYSTTPAAVAADLTADARVSLALDAVCNALQARGY